MNDKSGDTSVISSPRPNAENISPKDKTGVFDDGLSARSNSSNTSEKTHITETSNQNATINGAEEPSLEVTTSNSLSPKATSATAITNGPQKLTPRNPITGLGLGDDGQRFRRNVSRRDGNPVTGEGYKPAGAEINTTIPSLNGANQVINKNRIPPGGFSSGLW